MTSDEFAPEPTRIVTYSPELFADIWPELFREPEPERVAELSPDEVAEIVGDDSRVTQELLAFAEE